MALDFDAEYTPASNAADADYPFGSAKNDAVPGDLSGTPLEKEWLNDFLGFHQKLLDFAGITPSGLADTILASDYFDALVKRINALSPYLVDSGAADAIIVTGDPPFTAYTAGDKIRVKIVATNTGAVTIDRDSLGVKNVKKFVGQALVAGDLLIDDIRDFEYDGTNWILEYANHGHTGINDGGGLGTLYSALRPYQNLIIKNGGTPDEQVDVDADWVILKDVNDNPRRIDTPDFTASNVGGNGQNKLFTGAVAANTWYAIWLTSGDSGDTSGLHLSDDLATVLGDAPAGYEDYGLLVGWILTDATDDFLVMYQIDEKVRCKTGDWTVSAGVASRDISAFVPSGGKKMVFSAVTSAGGAVQIHPVTFTLGDGNAYFHGIAVATSNVNYGECPLETAQTVFDGRTAANTVVYVQGWEY